LSDAASALEQCADALDEAAKDDNCWWDALQKQEVEELANKLREVSSEVEGVECPGMY
jgi:hypothetical protein